MKFPLNDILYEQFLETEIINRTFGFALIDKLISKNNELEWQILGFSFEERPIRMTTLGKGNTKVLLWSQMHGNEPTATAALFDLLNFFKTSTISFKADVLEKCTLYIIPVVNPDGLEIFTRRNAQKIDINRDYFAQQSPEGKILKEIRQQLKPDFAFNLHDQDMLYSMPKTDETVSISLLAPAIDAQKTVDWTREQAIKVIACINKTLQQLKLGQIARFNDDFEPRAFGDNFQKAGSSTVLIESGFIKDDLEKQEVRKLNFFAILSALHAIAYDSYQEKDMINYLMIPEQKKQLLNLIIKDCNIIKNNKSYRVGVGLVYEEILESDRSLSKVWSIKDVGDLSTHKGLEDIEAEAYTLQGNLKIDEPASFVLLNQHQEIIIKFENGIRV